MKTLTEYVNQVVQRKYNSESAFRFQRLLMEGQLDRKHTKLVFYKTSIGTDLVNIEIGSVADIIKCNKNDIIMVIYNASMEVVYYNEDLLILR